MTFIWGVVLLVASYVSAFPQSQTFFIPSNSEGQQNQDHLTRPQATEGQFFGLRIGVTPGPDDELGPVNYGFHYEVANGQTNFGHQEQRINDNTKGSYHALLPDGTTYIVDYRSDKTGYHPLLRKEV